MKTALVQNAIVAALVCALGSTAAQAQQVPLPKTAAEVPGPVPGILMTKEYVQMVGRLAYVWGWPMVNIHNRRAAFAKAPQPGLMGGVLPIAPVGRNAMLADYIKPDQSFIASPNQDVAYGAGAFALDKEPAVFQVPEFGDRFWVYALYDARTDELATIGKQYGTKPGFYLMVGPNWKGEAPQGITAVVRSSTEMVFVAPRVFKDDTAEDTKAVQPLLNQIMFYPLSEFDGKMKTTDWSKVPSFPAPASGGGETKWVVPEAYFDQLAEMMKLVPPLPGEEALYGLIRSVWDAAAKNPETKKALVASFFTADKELIAPLFQWRHNGRPVGNGWNSSSNPAQWGTDYLNRTAVAKSSMFSNSAAESTYHFRDFDSTGQQLSGKNSYAVTFAKGQLPPVKGFWSLTLYNEHHFFYPNALKRYSLGTKNKALKYNDDGSLTLYAGPKSPGKDKESNWLPAPTGTFSLFLRSYWPEQAILDGTWTPPNVVKVK